MRVAFFTQPDWAFGNIYTALTKWFRKYDIYADIIPWENYTDEFARYLLKKNYDVWCTSTHGLNTLVNDWGIDLSQIVITIHSPWDHDFLNFDANKLKGFTTINSNLNKYLTDAGIDRTPTLTRLGIEFDAFYHPNRKKLQTMGYAGAVKAGCGMHTDWKRYGLYEKVLQATNMINMSKPPHMDNKCMPGFYQNCDAVLITSNHMEAGGLPIMESAASGALTLSAKVGIIDLLGDSGGVVLPLEGEAFVNTAISLINVYKKNEAAFSQHTKDCQEFARYNYDWSVVIESWIDAIVA